MRVHDSYNMQGPTPSPIRSKRIQIKFARNKGGMKRPRHCLCEVICQGDDPSKASGERNTAPIDTKAIQGSMSRQAPNFQRQVRAWSQQHR